MTRILSAVLLAAFSVATFAQTPPPPARVRGTVEKLENNVMTVKTASGPVSVKLADNYAVVGLTRAKVDDIGAGKFIGTATLGERNGGLVALEVHIFPEAMRGVGEGHYPWDLKPESKMTNGNVADVKSMGADRMLTVQYKGGEQKVLVPSDAYVVLFGPAERSELKAGANVFCVAQRAADGSLSAARVNIGLNGVIPPILSPPPPSWRKRTVTPAWKSGTPFIRNTDWRAIKATPLRIISKLCASTAPRPCTAIRSRRCAIPGAGPPAPRKRRCRFFDVARINRLSGATACVYQVF